MRQYGSQLSINMYGVPEVNAYLDEVGRISTDIDLNPVWPKVLGIITRAEKEIFVREGSVPNHSLWQSLSEKYRKWKEKRFPGKGILHLTGKLENAATVPGSAGNIIVETNTTFIFGVDPFEIPYAHRHQVGWRMPKRTFLHLWGDFKTGPVHEIFTTITAYINDLLKQKKHNMHKGNANLNKGFNQNFMGPDSPSLPGII